MELINSSKAQVGAGRRNGPRDPLWGGLPYSPTPPPPPVELGTRGKKRVFPHSRGAGQFPWITFGVIL